ncbi:MAG: 7-cyano-7-deazaguanine synthase QueC [Alphaproteobacteria bacterium]|nr:7-cyano-7-deazaguanine synthase QueC [Alphaproteobacteria bacterium]
MNEPSAPSGSALVLFSGGQDSTVCLAWALARYDRVETVGFDYGQRHSVELTCREPVMAGLRACYPDWGRRLGQDHMVPLRALGEMSETAMTRETAIEFEQSGLPSTFVPGRNLIFLAFAGALAYRLGVDRLVGGMCETDYSGYPDCRRATLDALSEALTRGLDRPTPIETPLMQLDKAGTWRLADALGGERLIDLIVEGTHTCYLGDRSRRHEWGYGCAACPACDLRARGWAQYRARVG